MKIGTSDINYAPHIFRLRSTGAFARGIGRVFAERNEYGTSLTVYRGR